MNVDYNKHNIVKYLANNKDKDIWKMSVSSIGFQSTKFLDSYPPKGHPFGYTFNPERGRILDEFSLIYITKGRGTFQSGNCSEKKITKGDVFLLFPREWHTYRPAKDIGWNEYFVTFQGEYFNKLLNKIFQPNDPIIHIGINEQIVKHFLEMLDCAKAQSPGFQAVMAGIMMHMIGDIYSINKNYAEDTGGMRTDSRKHLRQINTGRHCRIHQHELFQSQEIIQAIHRNHHPSIHFTTKN